MLISNTFVKIKKKLCFVGDPSSIVMPKKNTHQDLGSPVIGIMLIHSLPF